MIESFTPVRYQGTDYNCAVTNFRILLFKTRRLKFTEIEHKYIASISLEGAQGGRAVGIITIIAGFIAFALFDLLSALAIILGLCGIATGIILLIFNPKRAHYYVVIRGGGEIYELSSTQDLLKKMVFVIRNVRHGETQVTERPSINVVVRQESPSTSTPTEATKLCVHCGMRIRFIAVFCDKCGKTQEALEPDILPLMDENIKFCIYCGRSLRPMAVYCDKCGKTLELPEPETLSLDSSSPESKFCVFCGSAIPLIANYCEKCGKKQADLEPDIF